MKELDIVGETGLSFFGKISASISHEIKNTLAVINENAGLMEDLSMMAEQGMELDPARIRGVAQKILAQVQRSDGIVKNLNRFAHGIDEMGITIDVAEIAAFTAVLAARLASGRGVTLKAEPSEKPVQCFTSPFFLEALIFRCLEFAMAFPGTEKTIRLITEKSEEGIRIRFCGLAQSDASREEFLSSRQDQALLDLFGAEVKTDSTKGEIVLTLKEEGGAA